MVGSALFRQLALDKSNDIVTANRDEIDLSNQAAVFEFLAKQNIDQIYLAAAKVGGINANSSFPAEFIYKNLAIQNNIIEGAYRAQIKRLMFLGSSCIYPKHATQPIQEHDLLTGSLEPTNTPYAVAKIAGIIMCNSYRSQYGVDYRSVMPTNLYGPGDNYHPTNSHVIPGLIRRFHEAKLAEDKSVEVWGTGHARREFLHVEDMAKGTIFAMSLPEEQYWTRNSNMTSSHINIGTGSDIEIAELASLIAKIIGYNGAIKFDHSKPDGPPRKLLSVRRINEMGWQPEIELVDGITDTYNDFIKIHGVNKDG